VNALGFGSGSLTGSVGVTLVGSDVPTGSFSVETRVRFPLTSSSDIQATKLSGSIWSLVDDESYLTLRFQRDALSSNTGSLILSSSDGANTVTLDSAGIFNNNWYNVAVIMDDLSSSLGIEVRNIDDDGEIQIFLTSSVDNVTASVAVTASWDTFKVGATASFDAEYWMQEVRLWNIRLTKEELDDHSLNFQSYGVFNVNGNNDDLRVHWRLDEDVTASLPNGSITVTDISTNDNGGSGVGFDPDNNPYKKFLNQYSYIASLDFGWNEEKVRIFDASEIKRSEFVDDSKIVSLEFNMIDSLNEDIVKMKASLDHLNEVIGSPVNKHRVQYDDLEILRHNYFKRLQGRLNFTVFADMLDFFDRSFIEMVKKLIPARAYFMGDEFVVESHMLERPKVTYERRKNQETVFSPAGSIEIWTRFGNNKNKSGRKFPLFLSGTIR